MTFDRISAEWARILGELETGRRGAFDSAAAACARSLRSGGKILAFGNGGSAAEAQHFAAELVNRFRAERPALRALALSTDTSALTSIGNDRGFEAVFSRQIEALGDRGDAALALSTSGASPNVLAGLRAARGRGMTTIVLTGRDGGAAAGLADILLDVPSTETPRIQEIHLFLLHALADEIETRLFG